MNIDNILNDGRMMIGQIAEEMQRDLKLAHSVAKMQLGHTISDDQAQRAVDSCRSDATCDEDFYDALKVYFNN